MVVDHFRMPDRQQGIDDPGVRRLLAYAESRQVWVKLSGAYRTSFDVARSAAPLLLQTFGADRLLWASDWPFNQYESTQNYATQRTTIDEWIRDAKQRETYFARHRASF